MPLTSRLHTSTFGSRSAAALLAALLAATTLAGASTAQEERPGKHGSLEWFCGTWEELLVEAQRSDRLVFVDFWTEWCGFCKKLDHTTFRDAAVAKEMRDVLCFSVDAEDPQYAAVTRRLQPPSYPTLAFLEPNGELREVLIGYLDPAQFVEEVRRVKRNDSTLSALRARITADPKDFAARFALAQKLSTLGDAQGHREQIDAIRALDPTGKSVAARRIRLADLRQAAASSLKPTALYAFLEDESDTTVLFEGWYAIWQLEGYLQRVAKSAEDRTTHRARAFAASRRVWTNTPADHPAFLGIGMDVVGGVFDGRHQFTTDDVQWALGVAEQLAARAPGDPSVLDAKASMLFAAGRRDDALQTLKRCIELEPTNRAWKERFREFSR